MNAPDLSGLFVATCHCSDVPVQVTEFYMYESYCAALKVAGWRWLPTEYTVLCGSAPLQRVVNPIIAAGEDIFKKTASIW